MVCIMIDLGFFKLPTHTSIQFIVIVIFEKYS